MFPGCKTLRSRQSVCFGPGGRGRGGGGDKRQTKKLSLSLPRVNLKILFWLLVK